MAATPASTTPAASPRQPAWTAPTTPAAGSASSTGAQSAVSTASTTPGSVVTSPSASPTVGLPSGGPCPSRPASTRRTVAPWTWRARAHGWPARPRTVATRRRLASARRRSSLTRNPRLRVANGALEVPPARPVKAATIPASSRSSATRTGGHGGSGSPGCGGPGRQASVPSGPSGSALEEGGDVQLVVIAVVAGPPLQLPPFGFASLRLAGGRLGRAAEAVVPRPALARGRPDRLVLARGGRLGAPVLGPGLLGGAGDAGR